MNDQKWYYESNGEQAGPISWDGLMVGLKQGTISSETRVWASHLSEWTPLGECSQTPSSALLPSPSQSISLTPGKKKWTAIQWVVGGISILVLIGNSVAAVEGFSKNRGNDNSSNSEGPQSSVGGRGSEQQTQKIKHEQEILKFAREVNYYTEAYNTAIRASNSRQLQSYIRGYAGARAQSLEKFRDSIQRYELAYGRKDLIVFARENGLQNSIGS